MAMLALSNVVLATTLALPALNTTRSTCPSGLGPGLHTIRMDVADATDPSFIWARSFDVYVPAEVDPNVESPVMLMWHGCG
eukprot:COSAG03_NODE_5621_length_1207_cov_3.021661_2_plen_80_part_01